MGQGGEDQSEECLLWVAGEDAPEEVVRGADYPNHVEDVGLMTEKFRAVWNRARKKAVVISYREVIGDQEIIETREGRMAAEWGKHYIIEGVRGETYPILKEIFDETYDRVETE